MANSISVNSINYLQTKSDEQSSTNSNKENGENSIGSVIEDMEQKCDISRNKFIYSQDALEKALDQFKIDYNVKLVSSNFKEATDALEAEGCPKCLRGIDDYYGPCILLSCKLQLCVHVIHAACIFKCDEKSRNTKVKSFHSSSFFVLRPLSMKDQDLNIKNFTDSPLNRNFHVSLEISHLISDATSMRINWPFPLNASIDPNTGNEYILLSLDKPGMNNNGILEENNENLPMFRAKRGRIVFNCTETSINQNWHHDCNYDTTKSEELDHFKLSYIDRDSQNTLTLGVRKEDASETISNSRNPRLITAFSLMYLKYELYPNPLNTPVFGSLYNSFPTPYQSNHSNNDISMSPLPSPHFPTSTNYHNAAPNNSKLSPFVLSNTPSPLNNFLPVTSPVYAHKLSNDVSGISSLAESAVNNDNQIITHGGQTFPFYQLISPKNISIPSSHSPSILKQNSPDMYNINDHRSTADVENIENDILGNEFIYNKNNNKIIEDLNEDKITLNDKSKENKKSKTENSHGKSKPNNENNMDVIENIINKVYYLSKTQSGSRFVQENLTTPEYFDAFYNEMKDHVSELMTDSFGHYAIEALFKHCNNDQKEIILINLTDNITNVTCHKQGSFSIQAIMDNIEIDSHILLISQALNKNLKTIILSCSGHYVILRFLQRFRFPYTKFIHKSVIENTIKYATDHYGLRVIKSVIEIGPKSEINELFYVIIDNANVLVENQYGNYIIQFLLDTVSGTITENLKKKMVGKFIMYSKQKFSSNVVEKCLKKSNKKWQYFIVRELLSAPEELISDKYGNYCLQTALAISDKTLTIEFTKAIFPHLNILRENIRIKWVKIIENANMKHSTNIKVPLITSK